MRSNMPYWRGYTQSRYFIQTYFVTVRFVNELQVEGNPHFRFNFINQWDRFQFEQLTSSNRKPK